MMNKRAFTLIELLIVVAIIGILAAIAVPNFMNAQTRAKVARQYSDMKSTTTAIEQLKIDKGVMLVDFWDDDQQWGIDRMNDVFGGVGNVGAGSRRMVHVLAPLTSPVAYMSSVPKDPFAPNHLSEASSGHNERFGIKGNDTYLYADWDAQSSGADYGGHSGGDAGAKYHSQMRRGDYALIGFGPNAGNDYSNSQGAVRRWVPYDASNGLNSPGDIMMKNGSVWK
jgi:prepilin-type N-terminal cleavage/methylation domain-containing protein